MQAPLSLHETSGESDGLFVNLGTLEAWVCPSQPRVPKSRTALLQEMEGERHIQRAVKLFSEFGGQRQRFVLQSEMWEDEWGCWRSWALVQHCEGDCAVTLMC